MYSSFQLARKYLQYYLTASNGKGHGTHSPFVYNFIINVLNAKRDDAVAEPIEQLRQQLLKDNTEIHVTDFGAGSRIQGKQTSRTISSIAGRALKPKKYAQLLNRIAAYYKTNSVVELGTSLGLTTAYLATAFNDIYVHSFEGVPGIADKARHNLKLLNLHNTKIIIGNFDDTYVEHLSHTGQVDLLYIDGNHRYEPTIRYYRQALPHLHNNSIVIFDDIHWSREMEDAWHVIKNDESVTLTIDLFFIGIAFFNTDFKAKQNFTIRY